MLDVDPVQAEEQVAAGAWAVGGARVSAARSRVKHVEVLVKIRELALLILGDLDPYPPNLTRRASPPPNVRRAPKPGFAFAETEQLVLYAVLTVYQDMDLRWVDGPWQGIDHHLRHGFAYANDLQRSGVARVLLERIAERSITPQPLPESPSLPAPSEAVPARLAAHDRDLAERVDRDIRAAALLDPTLSLDTILLGNEPRE